MAQVTDERLFKDQVIAEEAVKAEDIDTLSAKMLSAAFGNDFPVMGNDEICDFPRV
ncbi:hypothetical protein IKW73_01530 [Candidatus Saccharibacteria bacterium]|nr:hypothetical protein [Candidatus Saccharibacteria bacterium]